MSRLKQATQRLARTKLLLALLVGAGASAAILALLAFDAGRDGQLSEEDVLAPGSEVARDDSGAIRALTLRNYRAGEHADFLRWLSSSSKSLRRLHFEKSTLDPSFATALGDLSDLEALSLRDSGNALDVLGERIRNVRRLGLETLSGDTTELEQLQLRDFRELESLFLGFEPENSAEVRLRDIDFLSGLHLNSLTIHSWSQAFAVSDFSGFSGLPRLKSFTMSAVCDPRVIEELLVGSRVEHLSWSRVGPPHVVAQSSQYHVGRLGDLSALTSVSFGVRFHDKGLRLVPVDENLERIDSNPEKYTLHCSDEFGKSLRDAQKLWNAMFFAMDLPTTAWEALGELPRLTDLRLWHVGFNDRNAQYLLRNSNLWNLEYYPDEISGDIREELRESISRVTFPADVREQIFSDE